MLLFESVLVPTGGEEIVYEIFLVVVLVSSFTISVVFDTPFELVVKGLTIKLLLMVLCMHPLRIYHFTGVLFL